MRNAYNLYAAVPILEVQNLSKNFGTKEVLKRIDFKISHGEIVSILGPEKAGKSTLLRCLNTLEIPSSGEVLHNGYNIISKERRVNDYNAKIGMVFQNSKLFGNMTVLENCMIGDLNLYKEDKEEARNLAMKALERVGMASYINFKPNLLSDGKNRKVEIARALVMEPEILLLDDPTGDLEASMAKEVLEVIHKLANDGTTMIIVTDEVELASEISSHVVFLKNGIIVEEGSPEVIFNKFSKNNIWNFLLDIGFAKNDKILINY